MISNLRGKPKKKKKKKYYKNIPNREKYSNQKTIIDKTEPKKLEKQNGKSGYL